MAMDCFGMAGVRILFEGVYLREALSYHISYPPAKRAQAFGGDPLDVFLRTYGSISRIDWQVDVERPAHQLGTVFYPNLLQNLLNVSSDGFAGKVAAIGDFIGFQALCEQPAYFGLGIGQVIDRKSVV